MIFPRTVTPLRFAPTLTATLEPAVVTVPLRVSPWCAGRSVTDALSPAALGVTVARKQPPFTEKPPESPQ